MDQATAALKEKVTALEQRLSDRSLPRTGRENSALDLLALAQRTVTPVYVQRLGKDLFLDLNKGITSHAVRRILGYDFDAGNYGPFTRESARAAERVEIELFLIDIESRRMYGGMSPQEASATAKQLYGWTKQYLQLYGPDKRIEYIYAKLAKVGEPPQQNPAQKS